MSTKWGFILSSLSLISTSSAWADRGGRFDDDADRKVIKQKCDSMKKDREGRSPRVVKKNKKSQPTVTTPALPLVTLSCGDVITESVAMAADLNCPDSWGFAISVKGDGVILDGNGKKIIAPNAIAGVFVQGNNDTIQNLSVNNLAQGQGVFAYDSPGLRLTKNDFSKNQVGLLLYAEQTLMNLVQVDNNVLSDSALFGIRAGQDGAGQIVSPVISSNDLSRAGSYAMRLQVTSLDLSDANANLLTDSVGGLYLKDGSFSLHDLSLKGHKIKKAAIFADSAASVRCSNLDVSSDLPAQPSQERVGLDLYRAQRFTIDRLTAKGNDQGFRLETEGGVSTGGTIGCSVFASNTVSNIGIVSYDGTPYGTVTISGINPSSVSVAIGSNTVVDLQRVVASCSRGCGSDRGDKGDKKDGKDKKDGRDDDGRDGKNDGKNDDKGDDDSRGGRGDDRQSDRGRRD